MKKSHSLPILLALAMVGTSSNRAFCDGRDENGNVGATSYKTLPFSNDVFQGSFGSTAGLTPVVLYYQSNSKSTYYDVSNMNNAKSAAQDLTNQNIIPSSSAQRWEDTYAASFPSGTYSNAPSYIASDSSTMSNQPEFVAWRNFITNHPQYWNLSPNGKPMPDSSDWNSWGGQWGHISFPVPLDAKDCPSDMTSCTYGDLFAYQWGLPAAKSGAYGIALSDFVDSQPGSPVTYQDFNPRIIAAFATWENSKYPNTYPNNTVPGSSTTEQATNIIKYNFLHWTDFWSVGYGKFFQALNKRLAAATGHEALIIDQGGSYQEYRRRVGVDHRIIKSYISPKNIIVNWDAKIIQSDRRGPISAPPVQDQAGFTIAAAKEPTIRNGAVIEAENSDYYNAIAQFYPSLNSSSQKEVGQKLLKRIWLYASWSHIADQNGLVRRTLPLIQRDYWDAGSLTSLDPLTTLIKTIYPTKTFGAAVYYSVSVERLTEAYYAPQVGANGYFDSDYVTESDIGTILDAGVGVNYFVSDAALSKITTTNGAAPSAWIVIDRHNFMTSSERQKLAAIAPIVSSAAGVASLPNQPLTFSNGLTGFGFYDQNSRLIVVVSNPSTAANASAISGTINLGQLADGSYKMQNLFTNATSQITVSNGVAKVPVSLSRWDSQAYAITK